jgi:hypothetical protein
MFVRECVCVRERERERERRCLKRIFIRKKDKTKSNEKLTKSPAFLRSLSFKQTN